MGKPKAKLITVIHGFGGRRCRPPMIPPAVRDWGEWDCNPDAALAGRKPTQRHAYGGSFPWTFDVLEKAYVLEGEATLTADDPVRAVLPQSQGFTLMLGIGSPHSHMHAQHQINRT